MIVKDTLRDISNDARGWLTYWTRDFTESEARSLGTSGDRPNPLAWQLGHLACVEDEVGWLFGGADRLAPSELQAVCSTGSPPPSGSTPFPSMEQLWALLNATHACLLKVLDQAGEDDLARPPRQPNPSRQPNPYFRSLGQAIYEAALHEAYHVGEIGALRKSLGKPRIG
jgi:hypothetical protein